MKYISEERLREIQDSLNNNSCDVLEAKWYLLEYLLEHECQELNQWQPIESAPKDETTIMLYYPDKPPCVGFWSYVSRDWCLFSTYRKTSPTHWAAILEPPK